VPLRQKGEAHFDDIGVSLFWLQPGRPMSLYHHEVVQENFLVLAGQCALIIEGEERPLQSWDCVHCPPRTARTIAASGEHPTRVLGVGARKENGGARDPVDPVAIAHGAGVPDQSTPAEEVYASFGEPTAGRAPDVFSAHREDILTL
jgi:uncharacterized cupin superfamily protein